MHDPKHVNVKGIQVLFSNHHEVLILKSETNYQILCYLSSLQTRAYHLRKIPFIAYDHHEVLILKSETNYQILCYLSSLQTRAYHLRKIPFIAYAYGCYRM